MDNTVLTYSPAPHLKANITTRKIMADVCIALLPACVMGVVYFGLKALLILALSLFSAVASEFIFLLAAKKPFREIVREFDLTSCVTGLLVGLTIGTNYPWYAPIFGSVFAVVVVKMLFGGTGSLVGPIIGVIFIELLLELIRPLQEYQMLLYGILLLIVIVALPGGLYGGVKDAIVSLKRRKETAKLAKSDQ